MRADARRGAAERPTATGPDSGDSRAARGIAALAGRARVGGLARTLGRFDLVALGLGAMIGGGVFVLTGLVAAQEAGPAVVLAYVVAGAVSAISALCYAELAAMMPVAGSAYTYAHTTMGELTGWLVGWLLLLEYTLGATLIAQGWAGYLLSFLRGLGAGPIPSGAEGALAAAAALLAGGLLTLGVRPSAYANAVLVLAKVAAISLFVAFGAPFVDPRNWRPFVPPATGVPGQFGWEGVARASALVFYAYVGFDAVATAAQEAKSPERDLPAGILGSLAIAVLLYVAVALVLTGIVPYARLGSASLGDAIGATGLGWVRFLVDAAVLAGLASVMLVLMLAQARVLFAMAGDGLLPPAFARIHPRFRSPWLATLTTTGVVALSAGLLSIRAIGEMVSGAVLVTYGGVCLGVVLLRRSAPAVRRPFRVPGSPALPVLGTVACIALLLILPPATWLQLAVWLMAGAGLYALRRLLPRRT